MTQVPLSLREQAAIAIAAALAPKYLQVVVSGEGVRSVFQEVVVAELAVKHADALVEALAGERDVVYKLAEPITDVADRVFDVTPPAPEPAPAPKKAARAAKAAEPPVSKEEPAPAPAAEPPVSKEEPAPAPVAETVDYATLQAAVLELVKVRGRDAVLEALEPFGVTTAKKLAENQWAAALAAVREAIGAEAVA